uniref:Proline and serine-rich protein 2 n=1 Tax=Callorhinchus milii TaxID=7868 RepID=A0A4W3IE90_CALMI
MNVSEILPKEEVEPESPGLDQRRASLVSPRQSFDWPLPPPDIGPPASPQPIGSVPTPLVIAQRIAENGSLSPTSPIFPSPPPLGGSFKHQRFPSNINVSVGNREYNSTITKASVNIQERKARVLANLGSAAGRLALESDERQQRARLWASSRSTSFKELGSGQARNEALSKLGLAKEPEETPLHNGSPAKLRIAGFSHSLKVKPTVSAAGETSPPLRRASTSKLDLPSPSEVPPPAFLSPSPGPFHPELRRLSSTPRPSGLRTPGITVQFSGRGSTDESRREALRKLGLLKSQ